MQTILRKNTAVVTVLIAALLGGISACDSKTDAENKEGVIPQRQLDALEKAKDVDNVISAAEEERLENIDE